LTIFCSGISSICNFFGSLVHLTKNNFDFRTNHFGLQAATQNLTFNAYNTKAIPSKLKYSFSEIINWREKITAQILRSVIFETILRELIEIGKNKDLKNIDSYILIFTLLFIIY
jgi:hypothetical protein